MNPDLALSRRGGRPRLVWILLALSLALNLCFLGGAAWLRYEASQVRLSPFQRFQAVANQLTLDPDQRTAFQSFMRELRQHMRTMHEADRPIVAQAWSELAKDKPDDAAVDHAIDQLSVNRRAFQLDASHALRSFLATLRPEQRTRFIELVRNREYRKLPPLIRRLVP